MPVDSVTVTFLGTAAGRPCATRNLSSLALKLDSRIWMVDAGEATQHRLMDARCSSLQMSKIAKVFITHLHADHINGLPGLLATISAGDGIPRPSTSNAVEPEPAPIEIYGPLGLRQFLRVTLSLTQTILSRPYVVHELLFPDEAPSDRAARVRLHPSEKEGRDMKPDENGLWRDVVTTEEGGGFSVSAAPILHTVRCLGYLFQEAPRPIPIQPQLYLPHLKDPRNTSTLTSQFPGLKNPVSLLSRLQTDRISIPLADGTVLEPPPLDRRGGRRLVILGDTYDATGMLPLVRAPLLLPEEQDLDPEALDVDLVIHEATNAFLPDLDDSQSPLKVDPLTHAPQHSLESVTALARSHGHSTPQVAGSFARSVRARRLVLNHLSVKYPDPDALEASRDGVSDESRSKWREMLREIARQAADEAGLPGPSSDDSATTEQQQQQQRVWTARDFMQVEVPRRDKSGKTASGSQG